MIEVTPSLFIDENDVRLEFIHSSGPGGQNVNKVATGVQLRYNLAASQTLPEDVRLRLACIAHNRINKDGVLIIDARRFRTQDQNREDALARLVALVLKAAEKPKPRKKTKPTAASQAERVEAKKHRGAIKRARRITASDLD